VAGEVDLTGEAVDPDAVRSVLCETGGHRVVGATMVQAGRFDPSAPDEVRWTCSGVPVDGQAIEVVATDIHGASTMVSVTPGR
jgi:hypothetical protein